LEFFLFWRRAISQLRPRNNKTWSRIIKRSVKNTASPGIPGSLGRQNDGGAWNLVRLLRPRTQVFGAPCRELLGEGVRTYRQG
jgi:hypothetical protein